MLNYKDKIKEIQNLIDHRSQDQIDEDMIYKLCLYQKKSGYLDETLNTIEKYSIKESFQFNILKSEIFLDLNQVKHTEDLIKKYSTKDLSLKENIEIDRLNILIHIKKSQYEDALEYSQKVLEEIDENSSQQGIFQRLYGLSLYYLSDFEKARLYLEKAYQNFIDLNDDYKMVGSLNDLGMIYNELNLRDLSLEYYEKANRLSKEYGFSLIEAISASNLGTIFQERSDYKQALKYYESSTQLYLDCNQSTEALGIGINIASLYLNIGETENSSKILDEIEIEISKRNLDFFKIYYLSLKGDLLLLNHKIKEAIDHYLKAHQLSVKHEAHLQAQIMYFNLANSYLQDKKPLQAERYIDSLIINEKEISPSLIIEKELLQAEINFMKGMWDQAEEQILNLKSRNIHEEYPEHFIHANQLLATIYYSRNQDLKAKDIENDAIEMIEFILKKCPSHLHDDYKNHYRRKIFFNQIKPRLKIYDQESSEYLKLLLDINRKINSELDICKLLELILDTAISISHAYRGFLILTETSPRSKLSWKDIEIAKNYHKKKITEDEWNISSSIIDKVLETKSSYITSNASLDPQINSPKSKGGKKLRSILVVPLLDANEVKAVLYLDQESQYHIFNQHDLSMATSLADLAVVAMNHVKVLSEKENELRETKKQLALVRNEIDFKYDYHEIIGDSPAMVNIFQTLDKVTDTDIPVIVQGESGTGKELVAKSLHHNSSRKDKPFVTENCAAIPEHLLESELFGYVKGAFTGADKSKDGLFRYADGGTIFLDEIGDMSLNLQSKILRVLQEKEVRPVGSHNTYKVDVRIVCASHLNLKKLVEEKKFRQDLFYRLNGISVILPALRERVEDIPLLVEHFKKIFHKEEYLFTNEAMSIMMRYNWPGNIRELEHVIRNSILFAKDQKVTLETLKFKSEFFDESYHIIEQKNDQTAAQTEMIEKDPSSEAKHIIDILKECRYNKAEASRRLGFTRKTLYNKIKKYDIQI